jgi:NTP pyrophosphatase (non-canonical NTP hydrolase)
MHFHDYQELSQETDQLRSRSDDPEAMLVPLLGLAGEVGELLAEYKKHLRDGPGYQLFKERVIEELGDLLWYLSNLATRFGVELEDIARANLTKSRQRWLTEPGSDTARFDALFPEDEQLPDRFVVEIRPVGRPDRISITIDGERIGDELTDNAAAPDSYRFHDVLHYAFAAVLGWSPVLRALLRRKRKSEPVTDEVEDGGRAIAIEEGIIAYIFPTARAHSFYAFATSVDSRTLRTIKMMTDHLEVAGRTTHEWERAILQGFKVWRALSEHGGGRILVDLHAREITYVSESAGE